MYHFNVCCGYYNMLFEEEMTTESAPPAEREAVVTIDLGKTMCRLDVLGSATPLHLTGPGARLGQGAGGIGAVCRAIDSLLASAIASFGTALPVIVGAAGTLHNGRARVQLAHWLAQQTAGPVAVTSDVVLAHVGAFAGSSGVCLIAGTGAIAMGVSPAGTWRISDGWGPDIGDLGGGTWIGREGLRAALNALERGGPDTVLSGVDYRAREIAEIAVNDPANASRSIASFAPTVIDAACAQDAVAQRIVGEGIDNLVQTAQAAVLGDNRVSILGGLTNNEFFLGQLTRRLGQAKLVPFSPVGTPADGALRIFSNHQLVLEGCVERA